MNMFNIIASLQSCLLSATKKKTCCFLCLLWLLTATRGSCFLVLLQLKGRLWDMTDTKCFLLGGWQDGWACCARLFLCVKFIFHPHVLLLLFLLQHSRWMLRLYICFFPSPSAPPLRSAMCEFQQISSRTDHLLCWYKQPPATSWIWIPRSTGGTAARLMCSSQPLRQSIRP